MALLSWNVAVSDAVELIWIWRNGTGLITVALFAVSVTSTPPDCSVTKFVPVSVNSTCTETCEAVSDGGDTTVSPQASSMAPTGLDAVAAVITMGTRPRTISGTGPPGT